MFLDFDVPLTKTSSTTTIVETAQVVTQTVTVTRAPDRSAGYLAKQDSNWAWDDLRDYVVHEIEARHGVQPRDYRKEAGIFKSFMTRYGSDAIPISRLAFGPVFDGMWKTAPISVTRFCKGSDPYFADVLRAKI